MAFTLRRKVGVLNLDRKVFRLFSGFLAHAVQSSSHQLYSAHKLDTRLRKQESLLNLRMFPG